ncbi:interleukin-6 [Arapaima gigas]
MEKACAALLLAVLVAALRARADPCFSVFTDTSEISGDELAEVSGNAPNKWESLAGALVCDVVSLRDAHFAEEFPKENMDTFKDYKVPVPYLVQQDGCFSVNFSKKRCLQRIVEGLDRYEIYLEFVEREYPRETQVREIMTKASNLIHIIKEKVKVVQLKEFDSNTKKQMLSELPTSSKWSRNISVHAILRHLSTFVTDAYRAIRYINQQQRKERP